MKSAEKLIIEQLKQGKEQSYKYIYDCHYVFLCHIANGYVNDYFIAETIVGDTIFHLWEIRDSLDITTSIRAYLTRSVRNRCLNYLISEQRKNEIQLSELASGDVPEDRYLISDSYPLGTLLDQELEEEINKSIDKLPEECKVVFKKSRFEEKKYEEIAQELCISINTVKYHMKNALASLQADLNKYLIVFSLLFLK